MTFAVLALAFMPGMCTALPAAHKEKHEHQREKGTGDCVLSFVLSDLHERWWQESERRRLVGQRKILLASGRTRHEVHSKLCDRRDALATTEPDTND